MTQTPLVKKLVLLKVTIHVKAVLININLTKSL